MELMPPYSMLQGTYGPNMNVFAKWLSRYALLGNIMYQSSS